MKLELLAPAGSYEGFEAAVRAGADAVYLGGNAFGARAYASNLDESQLIRAIDTAHILEKKIYLTVNTLVKDEEFGALYDFLLPLYEQGLDAAIVQDTGVLLFLKEYFPELPVHASTQMTITGEAGASLLEKAGVKRVIPARELSLPEIRRIRDTTSLEIECFVHGALCYCYSGQCLMSSMIGGRSGNRGRCAQPCRLPYKVYDTEGRLISKKDGSDAFALSTKDICAASYITEMALAGVTSFKIEGRMKSPEYTAGVVSIYRKYVDLFENGVYNRPLGSEDQDILKGLFNREGFGKSYLFTRNGPEMMAVHSGNESEKSRHSDKVTEMIRQKMRDQKASRPVRLDFYAKEGKMGLSAAAGDCTSFAESDAPQKALKNPADAESIRSRIAKTGDTLFVPEKINVRLDEDLFIPVGAQNALRREALDKLASLITEGFKRKENGRSKAGAEISAHTQNENYQEKINGPDPYICASVSYPEQAEKLIEEKLVSKIYVPYSFYTGRDAEKIRGMFEGSGVREAIALPYMRGIFKGKGSGKGAIPEGAIPKEAVPKGAIPEETVLKESILKEAADRGCEFLVRNIEDAAALIERGFAENIRLDEGVYSMNRHARRFWQDRGVTKDTVPYELNGREIQKRDNTGSELTVYGRIPVMISAQCIASTYGRCRHDFSGAVLKDRKGFCFPVSYFCDFCYNVIYNSVPVSLLGLREEVKKTGVSGYRLDLTDESPKETLRIADAFRDDLITGKAVHKEWYEFTRGHFKRGVL